MSKPRRDLSPHVRRKTANKYHHGDLRRVLLDAGVALVSSGGPEAATLRAVARKAGVSASAPYNHFAGKAALLAAVAEEGLRVLVAQMREARAAAPTPATAFEAIGLAYVRFALSHPTHFRLLGAPDLADKRPHPSLRRAYEEAFEELLLAIRECQKIGAVQQTDERAVALAAWSIVHGLAWLMVDGEAATVGFAVDVEVLARTTLSVLSQGFGGRAPDAA